MYIERWNRHQPSPYLIRHLSGVAIKIMEMERRETDAGASTQVYDCNLLLVSQNEGASKEVD